MGRTARANLPGVPFHLTARVQGREPLFAGAESPIVDMLLDSVGAARMPLLAYAIMPNHLHVIVVQGARPLSALMQPLLRRIAVRVARRHRRSGHLFERRYRDHPCLDAAYLRSAIAYVHLNPVRAGLCRSPDGFPWTSHHAYAAFGRLPAPRHMPVETGLRLFARDDESSRSWLTAYHRYLDWRQTLDTCSTEVGGMAPGAASLRPITDAGDAHWVHTFGSMAARARTTIEEGSVARRPDLADIARVVLDAADMPEELAWLRSGERGRLLVRIRRQVIARALVAGYSPSRIAHFLRVSCSTVSIVAATRRAVPH